MNYFYHSGSLGDMIYSLPTVRAMGGGVFITGMSKEAHDNIAPLLLEQEYIKGVLHVSESGLPPDFINLSNFRNHPLFTRKHIAVLTAETFGVDITGWEKGWLSIAPDIIRYPMHVFSVTSRYRDRFFSWKRYIKDTRGVFIGLRSEYDAFIDRNKLSRSNIRYRSIINLKEAKDLIESASLFSGNQSCMLAIRQGLGLPYSFEQSPNHLDTEQGSIHETILNPITRRIHLASICAKKALFDIKTKRFDA